MGRELVINKKANAFILSLPESQRKKIKEAVTRLLAGDFEGLDIKRLQLRWSGLVGQVGGAVKL